METTSRLICGSALSMEQVPDASVDLIVTSPPYPMVAMWDDIFIAQDGRIGPRLAQGEGRAAFDLMHQILDTAWEECSRVLKPGGLACINIGDATRTLNGDFQLYSNHSRILNCFLERGFAALPDILWRKQTNAPNKFMGSGMLPVERWFGLIGQRFGILRCRIATLFRFNQPRGTFHAQMLLHTRSVEIYP